MTRQGLQLLVTAGIAGVLVFVAVAADGAEDQINWERARRERQSQGLANPPSPKDRTGLVPLADTGKGSYKGEDLGLYGNNSNTPPPAHLAAAMREAAKIVPLDASGRPSPGGKIVLLSIGMSNTTQEFSEFKRIADADPAKSPNVVIVDCAQGGQDAIVWARAESGMNGDRPSPWTVLDQRLTASGVTALQVQAAWLKQARAGPAALGAFPAHARELQANLVSILEIAKKRCPNLRLAFLSSRVYAGYATTNLNPEPYAYESAFSVRWVIQDQIKGEPALNFAPERGEARAPLALWGPYLWADGVAPRPADGLVWKREDLGADGTHPSMSGRQKVAALLLEFFKSDPSARPWFTRPVAPPEGG